MLDCLKGFVINHLVIVQVEKFVQLKNLLPVKLLEKRQKIGRNTVKVVYLLLEAAHFHFEDGAKWTRVGQDFAVRRLTHMTIKVDSPC